MCYGEDVGKGDPKQIEAMERASVAYERLIQATEADGSLSAAMAKPKPPRKPRPGY